MTFKNFTTVLSISLFLLFLSNCATWTADKCQSTNWDSQGYADGSVGKNNSGGVYASKCQKKGVKINDRAYTEGYNRGLTSFCNYNKGYQTAFSGQIKESLCASLPQYSQGYSKGVSEYCTNQNGYKVAIDGGEEAKICSGASFSAFMSGYKKGRKKFVLEEINNLKEDLSKANKDLDDVRDNLADKQNQLSRMPKHSFERSVVELRAELEQEVQKLTKDRDSIKNEVASMEDRLRTLEKEARN